MRSICKNKIWLAICFVVCGVSSVQGQIDKWGYWENGVSEAWWFSPAQFTTQQADEAIARWKRIGDESRGNSSNDWTGTYFRGSDVHGTYVRLAARNGFVIAHVDKCQAKVVGLTYGTVEFSTSIIQFVAEFQSAASTHAGSHAHVEKPRVMRFVPVKVNGAKLLVEEDELLAFGDYMAGLGKFNFSDFHYSFVTEFLTVFPQTETAINDQASAATQPPDVVVPSDYFRFLKKPIEATITKIGRRRILKTYSYENSDGTGVTYHEPVSLTTVVVNAGTTHGLKRGMFLNLVEPRQDERVRILRAGRISSTGVIIRSLESGREVPFDYETRQAYSKIVAGRKLTTSPF